MKVLCSDTSSGWNTAKIVWIFVGHLRFVLPLHLNLLPMNADIRIYSVVRMVVTYPTYLWSNNKANGFIVHGLFLFVSVSALILGLFDYWQMHTIPLINWIFHSFLGIPYFIEYVHRLGINISLAIIGIREGCILTISLRASMTFGSVRNYQHTNAKR